MSNKYLPKTENTVFYYDCSPICGGWEGIRKLDNDNLLIIGSTINGEGLVFIGSKDGQGYYKSFKVPLDNVINTFCYSGDYLGNKIFRLVGTFSKSDIPTQGNKSYIYVGEISDIELSKINNYIIVEPKNIQNNIIFHSVSNKLIVGNSDSTILSTKEGIIYDIEGKFITAVFYPDSIYTNLYGIIYNKCQNNYTIVGGYSKSNKQYNSRFAFGEVGFIVDYNQKTNEFSNWTTIELPKTFEILTDALYHIEGISLYFDSKNTYSLAFCAENPTNGERAGGLTIYKRIQGGFERLLEDPLFYQYDPNEFCFGDSVVDNIVVGIRNDQNTGDIIPYQAEIFVNDKKNCFFFCK